MKAAADFTARAQEWLRGMDTGLSSEAVFHYMTLGIKGGSTPSDSSDLGRCLRLLERFPEWRDRLPEMAAVSEDWALLMPHWAEIEASFIEEAGGSLPPARFNFSAPKTFEMMQDIFYERDERGFLRRKAAA